MIAPYYQEDGITLYCGDCREILPQLTEKFDLVLTDPPYGVEYRSNRRQKKFDFIYGDDGYSGDWMLLVNLAENGSMYIFCSETSMEQTKTTMRQHGFPTTRVLVWDKGVTSCGDLDNYGIQCEYVLFSKRKYAKLNGSRDSNIVPVPRVHPTKLLHPTQKPVELLQYLVMKSTSFNQLVFDPFCGSGTTLVAAKQLNRKAVGIEISERYCEIAVSRLQQMELFHAVAE